MARVTGLPTRLAWDAVAGADDYNVHVAFGPNANFLAEVDAGTDLPFTTTLLPEFTFSAYSPADFNGAFVAVVAHADQNGIDVYSDPYMPPEFQALPLAFTPVAAPTNGRLLRD